MEISEVIQRWQAGNSRRQIASGIGLSKDTVGKYIAAAQELGVSIEGAAPAMASSAGWQRSGSRGHGGRTLPLRTC